MSQTPIAEQAFRHVVSSLDAYCERRQWQAAAIAGQHLCEIVLTINDAKSAPIPPYLVNLLDKLKTIIGKPKADTPGYTSKARFAIMDIVDALPN
jgi:hypothetical protein